MKTPLAVLVISYAIFFACLYATMGAMPARMAAHFDAAGRPDGWLDRWTYVKIMGALAVLAPLFILAMTALAACSPIGSFKIPHREYWLAPERRGMTLNIFTRYMLFFCSMLVFFFAGVHLLVVAANMSSIPQLSSTGIGMLAIAFILATLAWAWNLYRRFSRINVPN